MIRRKDFILFILPMFIFILSIIPAISVSAVTELSSAMKAKLDKLAAATEPALKREIESLYGKVLSLQQKEQLADKSNQSMRRDNDQNLSGLRQRIKEIDKDKIRRLETQLEQTRKKYEPLFALYRVINKRSKDAESLRVVVELARLDIKRKTAELKTAKDERTNKITQIRNTLSRIDSLKKQISSYRSKASQKKKQFKSEWSSLGQAIKKSDPKRVKASLLVLESHMFKLIEFRNAIRTLESDIAAIVSKANSQIP